MPLVSANGLSREFVGRGGATVYAVDGVDLMIDEGEAVGLIGESGSGKSTIGRLLLRLLEPTGGTVEFDGDNLGNLSGRDLRRRRADFQVVFQEPFESLDPRMTVRRIVEEPLLVAPTRPSRAERHARVAQTLVEVGLSTEFGDRRPGNLSGGEQQRVGVARALVTRPRFIVLDEPTASLDLTVRAAILNMLGRLRETHRLTYLFISHDIQTVRNFCDRIAVMYLGRIVELGSVDAVLTSPRHPYTRALLSAELSGTNGEKSRHEPLVGDPPKPTVRRHGCSLAGRCPIELPTCATTPVTLRPIGPDREVACIRADEPEAARNL
jgi:peptide/nickel transport system ATP-binding protein/oligopeptide transport system ATP-binding protein